MKNFLILIFCLLSWNAFSMELDVLSSEFPLEDQDQRKTLCLTVVRVPASGKLLGIVEDITDCFYARKARKIQGQKLDVETSYLKKIMDKKLGQHLQRIDPQLEFYFSDGE